ncbi:hypothetical protein RCOM_0740700 [Ricinus communis]|uniref:Uncharacterized protein n=1 Tax=Ricinus communis TaxID=3988 RepID=B9SHM2_RICCO|nr:hypothetical protein RCOM_0740700 [Ricinus communis]
MKQLLRNEDLVVNFIRYLLALRHESKLIQDIVEDIFTRLNHSLRSTANDIIGIDSHLEKLHFCLGIRSNDVRIVGIHEMGGIGKATLARVIFDGISNQFEASSFLTNVREVFERIGLVLLQQQLLCETLEKENIRSWDVHKGFFVILDDVDKPEQLEALVGKQCCYGLGSRIIITTRDLHLLVQLEVDAICKMEELNDDEALRLFSLKKAFKSVHPEEDFVELSNEVVRYAHGLPLTLEVLCSFLYAIGIRVLLDKSLINIVNNRLWMHDLLQEMGQKIVLKESLEELRKRSRLWVNEDVNQVLTKNSVLIVTELKQLKLGLTTYQNKRRLKFINLSYSQALIRTPNLTGAPNLVKLCLEGCLKLSKLPEKLENMECLEELDVSGTAIRETPSSIVLLKNLKTLSFYGCGGQPPTSWRLQSLPELPTNIKFFGADDCVELENFPNPVKLCTSTNSKFNLLNCQRELLVIATDSMFAFLKVRFQSGYVIKASTSAYSACPCPNDNTGSYRHRLTNIALMQAFTNDQGALKPGRIIFGYYTGVQSLKETLNELECFTLSFYRQYGSGWDLEIRKCALRLVYAPDLEELYRIIISSSLHEDRDIHSDDLDKLGVEGIVLKQGNDGHDGPEPGESRSSSDASQAKR